MDPILPITTILPIITRSKWVKMGPIITLYWPTQLLLTYKIGDAESLQMPSAISSSVHWQWAERPAMPDLSQGSGASKGCSASCWASKSWASGPGLCSAPERHGQRWSAAGMLIGGDVRGVQPGRAKEEEQTQKSSCSETGNFTKHETQL